VHEVIGTIAFGVAGAREVAMKAIAGGYATFAWSDLGLVIDNAEIDSGNLYFFG
jgi:hypothetical protein